MNSRPVSHSVPPPSPTSPRPQIAPGARTVLESGDIRRILTRIAHEIVERNHGAHDVVNGLLELLDGVDSREGVVVIGATNAPDNIDPAILRAQR